MSYDTAKLIEIKEAFSGGWVTNTPDLTLAEKYSLYMINWRFNGMSLESRPGHSLFAELTTGSYPKGIGSYLRTSSSNDRLVVRHNQDTNKNLVTIETDGTVTEISTSTNITSDNRMNFVNIADVIYCMNGSDNFGKLSGTTYTTPSTGISNFAPAFGVVFNSSLWASGWSTNSNKVYKSVGDNYEDFNSSGSDSFTFQETITGLATNNQALFYFTKNSISVTGKSDIQDIGGAISYLTRPLQTKEGAVNHSCIVTAGTEIFYVTPTNSICKIAYGSNIEGYETYDLSARKYAGIDNYLTNLDKNQSEAFGYYLPNDNIIKWFFKSKNSTINDVCIVYDISKDAFLLDTNKYFYGGIEFKGYNYTISMIESKVFLDEYGYDDEDGAIESIYETKYLDFGIPGQRKELWESISYVAINELAELTQEIIIDGNIIDSKVIDKDNIPITTSGIGTKAIGTYAIGTGGSTGEDELYNVNIIRTKGNLQVKFYKMKYRFYNNALAGRVRLEFIRPKIEVLPMIQSDLTN